MTIEARIDMNLNIGGTTRVWLRPIPDADWHRCHDDGPLKRNEPGNIRHEVALFDDERQAILWIDTRLALEGRNRSGPFPATNPKKPLAPRELRF